MLTGRKLLLADDSAAIRKVIELTFSDEGMEVTSVGDGRAALEKLEQVAPDVVLADVFMPEIGGYEVCRLIKQNERFARTPVMLLVSSFDPFDEAEARSAGADDIVAKPFQSIRQLVSRVGSLLRDNATESGVSGRDYSMLGLQATEPLSPARPEESEVTVLVEAPKMETIETTEPSGATCSADIELQTADTMRFDETSKARQLDDTIEIEPVLSDEKEKSDLEQQMTTESIDQTMQVFTEVAAPPLVRITDEPLLDIEDDAAAHQAAAGDVVLDLDFEEVAPTQVLPEPPHEREADKAYPAAVEIPSEPIQADQLISHASESMVPGESMSSAEPSTEAQLVAPHMDNETAPHLSPEAIDAIARRVIERMSDKVVRDIAWEVVPELAELLIKKRLDEEK